MIDYMTPVVDLWRAHSGLPVVLLVRHCYAEAWSDQDLASSLRVERRGSRTRLNEILQSPIDMSESPA